MNEWMNEQMNGMACSEKLLINELSILKLKATRETRADHITMLG